MQRLFNTIRFWSILLLVVGLAACANDEANPEGEAPTPTPELQVVVFETPDPTATLADVPPPSTEEANPVPTDTPTATVGGGAVTSAETQETSEGDSVVLTSSSSSGGNTALDFSRPPDVNPLTGLKVSDPAVLQRRPLMVRVGNDVAARPQVGLNQADVIYEEITEWWVTRFTAIFLSQDPEMIAPIRSARLINLQLGSQYQGALGNSGGSDGVRWELSQSSIVDLDEFFVPLPYFYRENAGWQTRLAFDATVARDYLADEGLDSDVGLRGFIFNESPDLSRFPEAVVHPAIKVAIPYPTQTSATQWVYDPASGKYLRFILEEPLMDFDGTQISASNVIIYFADHQQTDIVEDSNGATSIRIIVNGRGAAWLLRDGQIIKGNWETDGTVTPNFIFDDGQPMPLKPGNSWIEVVPLSFEITIDGTDENSLGTGAAAGSDNPEATTEPALPTDPTPTLTPIGARAMTPEAEATEESN